MGKISNTTKKEWSLQQKKNDLSPHLLHNLQIFPTFATIINPFEKPFFKQL